MHGGSQNYNLRLETGHQRGYEPYTRGMEDQSSFTPLMSPAMTPLEHQLRFPEYTTPGEYLSPLTSPALEARQSNGAGFNFPNNSHMDYGMLSSPTDLAHQHHATSGPLTNSPKLIQKQRRKSQASRLSRQSPLVRPLNGRPRPQTEAEARARTKKLSAQAAANRTSNSRNSSSNEGSGLDSVSPEPLTEPLMPPPALPRSGKSPYMGAQDPNQNSAMNEVATPATLMKLQKQQISPSVEGEFSRNGTVVIGSAPDEHMEDISLPEPASFHGLPSGESTPTLHSKPPQILKPRTGSISELRGTSSVTPSPIIRAIGSPSGPVGLKRSDSKQSSRVTKKRQSAAQSPALRPKISPSIQPLIRADGMVSSQSSALHLASKSNYQHILEGTLLPGVTYPEALAENLSSKRTNHKLAEQGRRNRINSALKEIESLLPASLTHRAKEKEQNKDSGEGGSSGNSKSSDKPPANQPISKASTVEMAIVYIKALQQELAETQNKLKIAESNNCNKSSVQAAPAPSPASGPESNPTKTSGPQISRQDAISNNSPTPNTTAASTETASESK
ncbi:uncharacterized protein GIQ15_03320 [Arthroderma uncinatum]|uniref:uncharacterized protein n=1 Tax=Arthroderma uncinatum TaxID=74035 RepID=UPI00144ACFE8|nr:uncharacterized protein GIQ15_03320 [Arthroderma uncinatum]KAF3483996.1 hypothetical protein GIQ15_03320 [Arthroderma uncinatum]